MTNDDPPWLASAGEDPPVRQYHPWTLSLLHTLEAVNARAPYNLSMKHLRMPISNERPAQVVSELITNNLVSQMANNIACSPNSLYPA
ncbi:uncharacterized protein TrAtP1_012907 [Trichoderma atroviride]|uniref:uncharacterized protein n=1 Tax=Hypocrea atroviridis TaxID=63577 RepID=UPI003330A6BD|nr:hypothetical protein TrAtP1_012907 [Trichoderma atroviride]